MEEKLLNLKAFAEDEQRQVVIVSFDYNNPSGIGSDHKAFEGEQAREEAVNYILSTARSAFLAWLDCFYSHKKIVEETSHFKSNKKLKALERVYKFIDFISKYDLKTLIKFYPSIQPLLEEIIPDPRNASFVSSKNTLFKINQFYKELKELCQINFKETKTEH